MLGSSLGNLVSGIHKGSNETGIDQKDSSSNWRLWIWLVQSMVYNIKLAGFSHLSIERAN